MDLAEQWAVGSENIAVAFGIVREHLGDPRGGERRFGPVVAIATGHELAFYNPVLGLDPATTSSDVLAGFDWIEGLGMPAGIQLHDGLDPTVRKQGG